MFVATVDYILNRNYWVLGVVIGNRTASIFSKIEFNKVLDKIIDEAKTMGANDIIGIHVYTTTNSGTCVIGPAIKF